MLPLCRWFIHAQLFILSRCGSVSCTYFCSKISSKHTINSSIFSFSRKNNRKLGFCLIPISIVKKWASYFENCLLFFRLFLLANGLCLAKNNIRPNIKDCLLWGCVSYTLFFCVLAYSLCMKKVDFKSSNTVLDFCLAKTNFCQWYHRVEILINTFIQQFLKWSFKSPNLWSFNTPTHKIKRISIVFYFFFIFLIFNFYVWSDTFII